MTPPSYSARDGGAAFPCAHDKHLQEGMSLRDYFAAQAMVAVAPEYPTLGEAKEIATFSYAIADAMLAERAKGSP